MTRTLDVARIQLVNWLALLAYPLAIVVAMPLLGWVIDISNGETATGPHEVYLLPVVCAVAAAAHLQTMTQVFPFALGLGVTRRKFAEATALVVAAQALLVGLVLVVFGVIERLSGGWGREARIFGVGALHEYGPFTQWLAYAGPLVAVSAICVAAGAVFQRWRQTGIYVAVFGGAALLAAAGALATTQDWWSSIGRFLGGQPSFALFTAYPLAFALALGGGAWLVLRRATA
ncbi:hypothetical protein SAMN05421504_101240 [Amycolatopsis xylanica]|uniref:ABC-2 type transport system permease protein n=1 Tax=Amycolatopsis xylanica TaxID=589385 RepID=A0A1H2SKE1_9PSEU|nr:hypothetical protein [Amycolatopsis xylanica]SDW31594.1 hypothetical protein SAMN05421504_101240 [Amycolatopsis xylanica]